MDRFQKFILLAPGKLLKRSAVGLPGYPLDGLKTKPISIAIRRHFSKTIAGDPALVQALVDARHDGNAARRFAVVLRQNVCGERFHQAGLPRIEETNRRRFMDAFKHFRPRRLVPKRLLLQRAETGVVAGLLPQRQRLMRFRIDRSPPSRRSFESGPPVGFIAAPSASDKRATRGRRRRQKATARKWAARKGYYRAAFLIRPVAATHRERGKRSPRRHPRSPAADITGNQVRAALGLLIETAAAAISAGAMMIGDHCALYLKLFL